MNLVFPPKHFQPDLRLEDVGRILYVHNFAKAEYL